MVGARRAAPEDSGEAEAIAELGTIRPARAVPQRRLPRVALRKITAPLAMLAVAGLASSWMFVPAANTATEGPEQATPRPVVTSNLGTSRSLPRPELATPSASPSPAPVAPAPSATPTPATGAAETPVPALTSPAPAAAASPAPAAAAPAKESAAPDYKSLAATAGTRYATSAVNVRSGPGVGFDQLTTLAVGDAVTVTERTADGWQQVVYKKAAGWVKASFLSTEAPAVETRKAVDTTASCPAAGNLEANLTDRTAGVLRALCARFDGVSSYGGYRPDSDSYHGSGRAIDVMVSGDYGWEIAKWARANASELGVVEVLYSQKIWTTQRSGEGWRSFSDRGGATANHYDHVHISVR